jgi:hypothetical protein
VVAFDEVLNFCSTFLVLFLFEHSGNNILLNEEFIAKLDDTLSDDGKLDKVSIQKASLYTEKLVGECLEKFKTNETDATCFQLGCAYVMLLQRRGKEVTNTDIYKQMNPMLEEILRKLHSISKDNLQKARTSILECSDKIFIMSVVGSFISDLIKEQNDQ